MVKVNEKTKGQLASKLSKMRSKINELEASETNCSPLKEPPQNCDNCDVLIKTASNFGIGIMIVQDMKDREGAIVFSNDAITNILGYSAEELLQMSVVDFASPSAMGELVKRYRQRQAGKEVDNSYETLVLTKDCSVVTVQIEGSNTTYQGKCASVFFIRDVSDRKQAEQKYRDIVEDINDGYIVYQERGIVLANRKFAEIFGYTVDQVLEKDYYMFIKPESLEAMAEKYARIMNGEEDITNLFEVEGIKADGTPITIDVSNKIIEYEGKPAFSVISRDITERKRMENELREKEEIYDCLMETANKVGEGIFIVQNVGDREGVIVFANEELARITGYDNKEIIGMAMSQFLPPEDVADTMDRYRRRQAGEKLPSHYELPIIRKDGTRLSVELGLGITTYKGKTASIAFMRDITERKQIENGLRESEELHRKLVETADIAGIAIAIAQDIEDREGVLTYANVEFLRITGYTEEEIIGSTFKNLLEPEILSELMDPYRKRQVGEDTPRYAELSFVSKDGTKVPIEISAGYMNYQDKITSIAFIRDITNRKRMEEELRDSEQHHRMLLDTASNLGIGIMMVRDIDDRNGAIVYSNNAVTDILGYSREEMLKMRVGDFTSHTDIRELGKRYRCRQAGKKVEKLYETSVLAKDGTVVTVQIEGSIITQHDKCVSVFFIRDVSDRKQAEQKYRDLIEDINDGYIVYQDKGIVLANRRFAEIFGYTVDQVLWKDFFMFIEPESLQAMADKYARVMSGEEEVPDLFEVKGIKGDGTSVILDTSIKEFNYEGKPAFSIIFRDITERKQIENVLRESRGV